MILLPTSARSYVREALIHWPLLFALFTIGWLVVLSLYVVAGKPLGQVPVVGGDNITTIAREPGTGYDVNKFCADPTTKVSKDFIQPESGGDSYTATRGTEVIRWRSKSITGEDNPAATHYYIDNTSKQVDEVVEMNQEAAKCFLKKAS